MKKILMFFCLFVFPLVTWAQEPVQNVFSDISWDYKYVQILQTLYDKGMISVDDSKKFDPYKLITREEFVSIASEVWCTKCMMPNTPSALVEKYQSIPNVFFDVTKSNKYYYCIADALQNDVVKGYDAGYKCADGTQKAWEKPFCTQNTITLEEAVAVLLRNSSVFKIQDNNEIIKGIQNGTISEKIAGDVLPKNPDGSVYSFYGYFKKALELQYGEYDISGKYTKMPFISLDSNGNLNPKKYITKEEFLKMAYVISKLNTCSYAQYSTKNTYWIWGWIKVFDASCKLWDENCAQSSYNNPQGTYDFKADVGTVCQQWISQVTWEFTNIQTKEVQVVSGQYLDNFKIPSSWDFQVKSYVSDKCGNKTVLSSFISNSAQQSYSKTTKIIVYDAVCTANSPSCTISQGKDPLSTYDFTTNLWINNKNVSSIQWTFANTSTQETFSVSWNYADNVVLKSSWLWKITSEVTFKDASKTTQTSYLDTTSSYKTWWNSSWGQNIHQIYVYAWLCSASTQPCSLAQEFNSQNSYDFSTNFWVKNDSISQVNWTITNTKTNEKKKVSGMYVDNFQFNGAGLYTVESEVILKDGTKVYASQNIDVISGSSYEWISGNIVLESLTGVGPFSANFSSNITWCSSCKYVWDFWDGTSASWEKPTHVYQTSGTYKVELTVQDAQGNSKVLTYVLNTQTQKNEFLDSDKDGVNDAYDMCKWVVGDTKNSGCPILNQTCSSQSDCKTWFTCNTTTQVCEVKKETSLIGSCLYPTSGSSIFWNSVCSTCPCNYTLDFIASLRKCDIIMPAIVSKDGKDIYSAGNYFQVKK